MKSTAMRPEPGPTIEQISRQIQRAKDALARRCRQPDAAHNRMVNLALDEASALAWQSGVPQLVFPMLAMEKIGDVNRWRVKQDQIRRSPLARRQAESTRQLAE